MSGVDGAGVVGKRKTTPMKSIQSTEMSATGALRGPSENGPGRKSFLPRKRAAMGVLRDTMSDNGDLTGS